LGTDNSVFENNISVFPNPTNTTLNISTTKNQTIASIELYSILGKKVLTTKAKTINISKYQPGIYLLKISTNKDKLTKKIIIQ